jgi:site-specific DNA recombinase
MHGKRNSHRLKPDSEIIRIPGGVPAIISQELWDRVQAMRKINPKGKSHNKYFYLLYGIIFCGECGYKMHGNPRNTGNNGPIYITYRCNRRDNNHACCCREVRREYIEGFVIEELFRHFFNENSIPLITKQLNEKLKTDSQTKSEEYLQYQSTLQLLKKSRANLVDAIKQAGFSKSIGTELKNTDDQIEQCESFLKECEDQSKNVPTITEEQVSGNLDKLKEFAKTSHREEVRAMIQSYVERVTVYNDRVEVTYKVAFLSSGDPITYHCDSSISRNNLDALGANGQLVEKSKDLLENLHTA